MFPAASEQATSEAAVGGEEKTGEEGEGGDKSEEVCTTSLTLLEVMIS